MFKQISKKFIQLSLVAVTAFTLIGFSASNTNAWRATHTVKARGSNLTARADLPYWSDFSGGGNWKAQATYGGSRGSKLKLEWSFYSIGGSVSYNGAGVSGSGSTPGSSFSANNSTVNASGRVYGNGLCLYVGMNSTASFSYGNSYYSTTTKI